MADLTQFQWALIFIALILGIGIVIVILFWIARKYPSKDTGRTDPFIKTIIIVGLLLIIHVGLIAFGILEQQSLEENIKYYLWLGIILLLWYAVIVPFFLKQPIPTYKLFKRYVMPDIRQLYGGTIYTGQAYLDNFIWSMVVPSEHSTYMQEQGIFNEMVECFLIQVKSTNPFFVFAIRDKFSGEGLRMHKNPPVSLLNSYLGKEVTKSVKDEVVKEQTTVEGAK